MNWMKLFIGGFNSAESAKRAETQMTLGKMIAALDDMEPDQSVPHLNGPHSYRGYYTDLAFELEGERAIPARDLLDICRDCMGRVFVGYKGGEYMMGENSPVWVANYGSIGQKLISINEDGTITTKDDN